MPSCRFRTLAMDSWGQKVPHSRISRRIRPTVWRGKPRSMRGRNHGMVPDETSPRTSTLRTLKRPWVIRSWARGLQTGARSRTVPPWDSEP